MDVEKRRIKKFVSGFQKTKEMVFEDAKNNIYFQPRRECEYKQNPFGDLGDH